MTLPQISIDEIVTKPVTTKITEPQRVWGNVFDGEIEIISKLVAYFNPQTIFEIGTFDGRTTINLASNSSPETKVYTLDLPAENAESTKYPVDEREVRLIKKNESGSRYKGKSGEEKIIQLYGDSATFDYTEYTGEIDFVFVDGSHSLPYVKNDTEVALSLKSSRGVIVWHDYGSMWEDVTKVLEGYFDVDTRMKNVVHVTGTTLAILFPQTRNK